MCSLETYKIDLKGLMEDERVLDFDLNFIRFRQHGNCGGGSVDAALRFGLGNALHAMNA